jgi:hypothetical protein
MLRRASSGVMASPHVAAHIVHHRSDGAIAISSIPRQLSPSPMLLFPRRIKHPLNMPIQRSHNANARKHGWPAVLCDQKQSFHRGLPFLGVVIGFGQSRDVERGVT